VISQPSHKKIEVLAAHPKLDLESIVGQIQILTPFWSGGKLTVASFDKISRHTDGRIPLKAYSRKHIQYWALKTKLHSLYGKCSQYQYPLS
jgi:hypothetical protein